MTDKEPTHPNAPAAKAAAPQPTAPAAQAAAPQTRRPPVWHHQEGVHCGEASVADIINQTGHAHVTEADVADIARRTDTTTGPGWLTWGKRAKMLEPTLGGGGTPIQDLPKLMELASGGRVRGEFRDFPTLGDPGPQDLQRAAGELRHQVMDLHRHVIVSVASSGLRNAYHESNPDKWGPHHAQPQSRTHDHLLRVTDFRLNSNGFQVKVYDTGVPNGDGLWVDGWPTFIPAWVQSHCAMVFTTTDDRPIDQPAKKPPDKKPADKKPADKKPADKKPADNKAPAKKAPGKKAPAGKAPAKGDAPPTPGPHVKEYTPFFNDPLWQGGGIFAAPPPPADPTAGVHGQVLNVDEHGHLVEQHATYAPPLPRPPGKPPSPPPESLRPPDSPSPAPADTGPAAGSGQDQGPATVQTGLHGQVVHPEELHAQPDPTPVTLHPQPAPADTGPAAGSGQDQGPATVQTGLHGQVGPSRRAARPA